MKINIAILIVYIIFNIYILMLTLTSSLNMIDIIPPLILLWLCYLLYIFGTKIIKYKKNEKFNLKDEKILSNRPLIMVSASILSIIFSIAAVNYYTGQWPLEVFTNIFTDVSVYNQYQQHFQQENISQFSIIKLPFIFMVFFIKFLMIYFYIIILLCKNRVTVTDTFILIFVTLSYLYFGIGRGTNFELFELLLLILFIIILKFKWKHNPIKQMLYIVLIPILILLGLSVYLNQIENRGFNWSSFLFNYNAEIVFSTENWLYKTFPTISELIYYLYGYFGFGIYYLSRFISEVLFESLNNFLVLMFPKGFLLFNNDTLEEIMVNNVYVGVRWHPDLIVFIDTFGLIGVFIFMILIGIIIKVIARSSGLTSMKYLTYFFLMVQFFSLPIGNFIFVSSANKLILVLIIGYWLAYFILFSKYKRDD